MARETNRIQKLKKQQFNKLIEYGTLISIDLIIENEDNKILLGLRTNKPANNYWFVPGGRILKGESKEKAFKRIAKKELNYSLSINDASLIDVYSHFYHNDNVNDLPNIDTHYIVLAYYVKQSLDLNKLPNKEHTNYRWFNKNDLHLFDNVHENVIPYFDALYHGAINISKLNDQQYVILNERRNSFNSLVWQTPVISLTAQAFLLVIALSQNVSRKAQFVAAMLGFTAALASVQLLIKHRAMEKFHAVTLKKYELLNGLALSNEKLKNHDKSFIGKIQKISSYKIWIALLSLFAIVTLLIMIHIIFPNLIIILKSLWCNFLSC